MGVLDSLYDQAMQVESEPEARRLFQELTEHTILSGVPKEEAEAAVKANLGYWAGYYHHTIRERVERLFNCVHPIFGPVAEGVPSPEEAFRIGQEWAKTKHLRLKEQPKDPVRKSVWERISEED